MYEYTHVFIQANILDQHGMVFDLSGIITNDEWFKFISKAAMLDFARSNYPLVIKASFGAHIVFMKFEDLCNTFKHTYISIETAKVFNSIGWKNSQLLDIIIREIDWQYDYQAGEIDTCKHA